jgi:hypothetical protein
MSLPSEKIGMMPPEKSKRRLAEPVSTKKEL